MTDGPPAVCVRGRKCFGAAPPTWVGPCLAFLFLFLSSGCGRSSQTPAEKTGGDSITVEVNSQAPAFAAATLDGGSIRLSDYVGKHVVLLEFWSIFCKSCVQEMPAIEALHARYRNEGLAVLSINTDVFSAKRVSSFLDKGGIRPPYPVVRDPRQEVVQSYKVELLPVTVIIDRSGWIRLYQEGYRPGDEEAFEAKIRKLLGKGEGQDVTLASRGGVTVFAPADVRPAEIGKSFPKLKGSTVGGGEAEMCAGKPCLLFFWSLFCKPCREEFGPMAELAAKHRQRGLEVYSVNVDSERLGPRVERFASQYPELPCLIDGSEPEGKGQLARTLGIRATPAHVLLDGKGTIVYAISGAFDRPALEEKIRTVAVNN